MILSLRLRSKVLLLALGPICLLTLLLSSIAFVVLGNLADHQEAQTRAKLVADRKAEIKQYVELAFNAIAPLYQASADGDMDARAQAVEVLEGIEGLEMVRFDSSDVVRHSLVSAIVDAYDAARGPAERSQKRGGARRGR